MIVWNEGHSRRNTAMHEKARSQNASGMPENSEKFCGAGAQSIRICGGRRVRVELQERREERKEVGSSLMRS